MPAPGATRGAGIEPGLTRLPGPVRKVCPVVLRDGAILAFRHPRAGCQLVKGTPELGETAARTASRELREESGLTLTPLRHLGRLPVAVPGMVWDFVLMQGGIIPDRFAHHCDDDGGHLFRFFWHPLGAGGGREWHLAHVHALRQVNRLLVRKHPAQDTRRSPMRCARHARQALPNA
ncbi:NUDIX domain-containing protein [Jannaschia rubra]|uniref:NUDIX domain-containing protein n=1 Tax=Jannaschia rubra TaxID=282197 RepID=UPI0024920F15|nr:NUDIX domain-containing protein [Jannaschia rubra]